MISARSDDEIFRSGGRAAWRRVAPKLFGLWLVVAGSGVARGAVPAEAAIGARLFNEPRFAEAYARAGGAELNARAERRTGAFSCATCHFSTPPSGAIGDGAKIPRSFCDFSERSPVPERNDGRATTPRNSPSLVEVLAAPADASLFHFDGEFATPEGLVKGTFLGRNFGWLPDEQAEAERHFARVIRDDDGGGASAGDTPHISYAILFRGTDVAIPAELRLPEPLQLDPSRATDDEILDRGAQFVGAFLRTLQFSRDASGLHNGSPYDAFLEANRLPRAPAKDQTPREYARRLGEAVAALRAPHFVDEPARRLRLHDQAFRFGDVELRGLKIFFKAAIGAAQTGGSGNCAECHVPPHFSDFTFHNTGVAQDEFDALHGAGEFAKLTLPDLATRNREFERWLPPTARHPRASGDLIAPAAADRPGRTDLGLWNVQGNPDLPAPQPALARLLNPDRRLAPDEVLAASVARFKTSGLRDLGQSAPYLHTGRAATIEDVILFYQRVSEHSRSGQLRNPPPEFFAMRLDAADVAPLAAFLRALNEDFGQPDPKNGTADAHGLR